MHVLATPPAFVLSQDQTLRFNIDQRRGPKNSTKKSTGLKHHLSRECLKWALSGHTPFMPEGNRDVRPAASQSRGGQLLGCQRTIFRDRPGLHSASRRGNILGTLVSLSTTLSRKPANSAKILILARVSPIPCQQKLAYQLVLPDFLPAARSRRGNQLPVATEKPALDHTGKALLVELAPEPHLCAPLNANYRSSYYR